MGDESQREDQKVDMQSGESVKLFNAVKADDVNAFTNLVNSDGETLRVCFGRFPLLSVCYLFDSEKIIKKYGKAMERIDSYIDVPEIYAIYSRFKSISGRAIRLYAVGDNKVGALEVLAMKDDMVEFKNKYSESKQSEATFDKLRKVFYLKYAENVSTYKGKFNCHRSKIPSYALVIVCISLLIATLAIVAACGTKPIINSYLGMGIEDNPYIVNSSERFTLALKNNLGFIKLSDDISVPDDFYVEKYGGTILGEGHKIYVDAARSQAAIGTFTGKLKDVDIDITEKSTEAYRTITLFAKDIAVGSFTNVNLVFRGETYNSVQVDFVVTFKISTAGQFVTAVANNCENIVLKTDINLDSEVAFDSYTGTIEGEGNTIHLTGGRNQALFKEYSGKLSNINIIAENIDTFATGVMGYLCNKFSGECDTLGIRFSGSVTDMDTLPDDATENVYTYFSLLAGENHGAISNITLDGTLDATGNGSGDFYFGSAVGINYGAVSNVTFNDGSTINLINTDVGAIVAENGIKDGTYGRVADCKNYAKINVESNESGWSVLAGGISVYNYGEIEHCINHGTITAKTTGTEIVGQPHIGGICAYNYNYIIKCLNKGDLAYTSGTGCCVNLYMGGIVGAEEYVQNVGKYPAIDTCGNMGNIVANICKSGLVKTQNEVGETSEYTRSSFSFVGGIAGDAYGYAVGCYHIGNLSVNIYESDEVTVATSEAYGYKGAIVGLGEYDNSMLTFDFFYGYYVVWNYVFYDNYYIADGESGLTTIGSSCQAGNKSISSGSSMGATALENLDALKGMEVYWDED